MNKKLIGLGVLTLVVGLGLVFVLSGPGEKTATSSTLTKNYQNGVKCVQHVVMSGLGDMENTIYFDSQNNRLYFESKNIYKDKPPRITNMIDNGKKVYMWGSGVQLPGIIGESGIIMDSNSEDSPKDNMPIDIEELEKNDFKAPGVECAPWDIDEEMFNPPKEIEFKNMDEMMGIGSGMLPGGSGNRSGINQGDVSNIDCEVMCSSIPIAEARKECAKSCQEN